MRNDELESNRWLDFTAVLILLAAGVATSWDSYQATRWLGIQDSRYGQANALHIEAARASSDAGVMKALDVLAFQSWLTAYAADKTQLQRFYQERFRPEFSIAFEKWLNDRPLMNPEAAPTPFARPEYRLESAEKARDLEAQAARSFIDAETAGRKADAYILNSVSLALALLFAGISQQFRALWLKGVLLCAAAASCGVALFKIATIPVQ
jgi:hypothetical protein